MQCVVAEVVGDKSILRAKVVTAYHRTNTGKHKKVKKTLWIYGPNPSL